MNDLRQYPNVGHSVLLCLGFVVAQFVLALPPSVIQEVAKVPVLMHPLGMGTVNILSFVAVLAMARWVGGVRPATALTLGPLRPVWIVAMVLSIAGAIILVSELDNLFRMVVPMPDFVIKLFRQIFAGDHPAWQMLFLLSIVAPVTEEVLCRGVILRGLLSQMRVRNAVLISAGLFGAMHLNPWQFVSGSALGLLFGWWYARTGSLWLCLGGHALANAAVWANPLLPFQIEGFTAPAGDTVPPAVLQPLWFDLLGLALLGAGIWIFDRWATRLWPAPPPPVPPVLPLATQPSSEPVPPPAEPTAAP